MEITKNAKIESLQRSRMERDDPTPEPSGTPLIEEALKTMTETTKILRTNFKQADADANGFLSELELQNMGPGIPKDKKTEAFSLADNYVDHIQTLSNDQWGCEAGISKADIEELQKQPEESWLGEQFARAFKAYKEVTSEQISSPFEVRAQLEMGNPIPLELAMNAAGSYDARHALFSKIKDMPPRNTTSMMPDVDLSLHTGDRYNHKMYFEIASPYMVDLFAGGKLYSEIYDPKTATRFNPHWQIAKE